MNSIRTSSPKLLLVLAVVACAGFLAPSKASALYEYEAVVYSYYSYYYAAQAYVYENSANNSLHEQSYDLAKSSYDAASRGYYEGDNSSFYTCYYAAFYAGEKMTPLTSGSYMYAARLYASYASAFGYFAYRF